MQEALSLRFAGTVRQITAAARSMGWVTPSFRSPPGVAGAQRTLRRRPDGSYAVAVALRNRPWPAVLADMIEGVVIANGLGGIEGERCREVLWLALLGTDVTPAPAAA